jgi:hypothetical protein
MNFEVCRFRISRFRLLLKYFIQRPVFLVWIKLSKDKTNIQRKYLFMYDTDAWSGFKRLQRSATTSFLNTDAC